MPRLPDSTSISRDIPAPSIREPNFPSIPDMGQVGRALVGAGNVISNFASDRQQELQQANRFAEHSRFLRFYNDQQAYLDQATQSAQPGAEGFADNIGKDYDTRARQYMQDVSPANRAEYDGKLVYLKGVLTNQARTFQYAEAKRYGNESLDDSQNVLLQQQARDPDQSDLINKDGIKHINESPFLSQIEKDAAIKDWNERQATSKNLTVGQTDPQKARQGLGVPGPTASASYVDRVTGRESGNSDNAQNPLSSAGGRGQFIDSTWLTLIRKYHPELAGMGDADVLKLKSNKDLSREMVGRYGDENGTVLASRGLPVNDGTLYLAHFAGAGGAVKLLTADPNTPASQVLDASAIKSNPFLKNWTVGQVVKWAATGDDGNSTVDPSYAAIPFEKRLVLAQQLDRKIEQQAKARIEQWVPDTITSLENTGSYNGPEPTHQNFTMAYPDEGERRFSAYQSAKATAQTVHGYQTMTGDQIAASLNTDRSNIPSGPGAAEAQQNFDTRQKAAAQVITAREKSPANYVTQVFPEVKQAWTGFDPNKPETAKAAITATVDAQRRIGIPPTKIQPMPPNAVALAVESFKDENKPIADRANAVTAMALMTPDVEQQQAIFRQMVEAGMPANTEAAVEAAARGDQAAAHRLYAAAVTKPENYPLAGDPATQKATKDDIESYVNTALVESGSIGEAYYGLQYGDPANVERAVRDVKLMEAAARINVSQGMDAKTAVDRATHDLFGDITRVHTALRSGASIDALLPSSMETPGFWSRSPIVQVFGSSYPAIAAGAERFMPSVSFAVEQQAEKSMVALEKQFPKDTGQLAILIATHRQHVQDVLANGVFRNYGYGNQLGFFDTMSNTFVPDADGKPITFTFDEIMKAGALGEPKTP